MKKSQLRNIIRESIKELMVEQSSGRHAWQTCPSGQIVSIIWDGSPGISSHPLNTTITPNGCTSSDPAMYCLGPAQLIGQSASQISSALDTYSEAFWQYVGSPNVGEVVELPSVYGGSLMKYLGTGQNTGTFWGLGRTHPAGNPNFQTNNGTVPFTAGLNCQGQPLISGCTDQNATNYDPNAIQDDGSCDYGWICQTEMPGKPMKKCVPGNINNVGTFATKQECIESGCEPIAADTGLEDSEFDPSDNPGTPPIDPVVTSKMDNPEDEEEKDIRERLQELANISKK